MQWIVGSVKHAMACEWSLFGWEWMNGFDWVVAWGSVSVWVTGLCVCLGHRASEEEGVYCHFGWKGATVNLVDAMNERKAMTVAVGFCAVWGCQLWAILLHFPQYYYYGSVLYQNKLSISRFHLIVITVCLISRNYYVR
jgi:hypothetical protein